MAINRDPIYQALFDHLKAGVAGVNTWSRKFISFDQIGPDQQPAVMVVADDEDASFSSAGVPTKWMLGATIVVYVREVQGVPETAMHNLIDAIEAAFERPPGEVTGLPQTMGSNYTTTLGGKVRWARISGKVTKDQGAEGQQAVALIPVEMLVTAFNP